MRWKPPIYFMFKSRTAYNFFEVIMKISYNELEFWNRLIMANYPKSGFKSAEIHTSHALSPIHGELGGSPSVVYRPDELNLHPRLCNVIRHHLARLILPVRSFVHVWTYDSERSPMVAKDLIRHAFPASTTFQSLNLVSTIAASGFYIT